MLVGLITEGMKIWYWIKKNNDHN